MRSLPIGIWCVLCSSLQPLLAQSPNVAPVRISAGSVLTFYLQSRLNTSANNPIDALPKGTLLRVKLLDAIDSNADADGAPFRAVLDAPLMDGRSVTLAEEHAEVRGLFVLLRNRAHPEGFRYELLLTGVSVNGKMQDLTATLNPSVFDSQKPAPATKLPADGRSPDVSPVVQQPPVADRNH